MGTPVKSPLQKKHKGDDGPEESPDVQITAITPANVEQALSLKSIEQLLDKKLDPLHQFLQQIGLNLNAFKESVRSEFESFGLKVANVEEHASDALARIEQLEIEFAKIKMSEGEVNKDSSNTRSLTMVVGNIPDTSSLDEAREWLSKHCQTYGISPPKGPDIYCKGSFSGLLFAKCQSISHRDELIQSIREASKQIRETTPSVSTTGHLFAKMDLPVDQRTVEGTLYSMKRMLVSWNFSPACVQFDTQQGTLSVAGREIVRVTVRDFSLNFEWCDGEWQAWKELQDSKEMADIKGKASARLDKAKARASNKGKGKGPE